MVIMGWGTSATLQILHYTSTADGDRVDTFKNKKL